MDSHSSRRMGVLSPMDLRDTGPCRLQPSLVDAVRLPLLAAQDQHRHRSANLLRCVAHRNGLLPTAQRASPRRSSCCVLDCSFHRHRAWLRHCDVVCVCAALLERYRAKSGDFGYAECCGLDYQLWNASHRTSWYGKFVRGGDQGWLVSWAFRVDSVDFHGAVTECQREVAACES